MGYGHIRNLLLEQWKNKDEDVQVYEQLPNSLLWFDAEEEQVLLVLKWSGYEVASPRVVEAIYAECVPVLILW